MNFRELEETLCRLPAVDAVRVVGDRDRITEVHVLADPSKAPKQIVRDIQSLAMARYGVGIDRRTVSVVQIGPAQRKEADRPAITAIEERPSGSRLHVTVRLTWRSNTVEGSAVGPAASSARLRLVGEATLRAVEEIFGGSPPLALEAITVTTVGSRPVVLTQVVSMNEGTEELAVGSALIRADEGEAVVRSVLDALNRRIPSLVR